MIYAILAGQSLDNNFQLCWKLFLDSLLFLSSGCILYLPVMENEQCKLSAIKFVLVRPYSVLLISISVFGGDRFLTQLFYSLMSASYFIMLHLT